MVDLPSILSSLGPLADLLKVLLDRTSAPSPEEVVAVLEDGSAEERHRLLQQQIAVLSLSHAYSDMRSARIEAQTTAILGMETMSLAVLLGMALESEGELDGDAETSLSEMFAKGQEALDEAGKKYDGENEFTSEVFERRKQFLETLERIRKKR